MAEATPRPWRRSTLPHHTSIWSDGGSGYFASFVGARAEEDLAFTLQAVNSFEELVAALVMVTRDTDGGPSSDYVSTHTMQVVRAALQKARS